MPPDYESKAFWDTRFTRENHFEWLGDGTDTIVPILQPLLRAAVSASSPGPDHVPGQPSRIPRLLHIGAGTSSLSDRIVDMYHEELTGKDVRGAIVNTDYSETAVEKGRKIEKGKRRVGGRRDSDEPEVRWEQADLLSWQDTAALRERCQASNSSNASEGKEEDDTAPFDFVADKSTSDAISCGDPTTLTQADLTSPTLSLHPLIRDFLARHPGSILTVDPLELLALHLACLVRPGGSWVALSYSSSRFPFLTDPPPQPSRSPRVPDARLYWSVGEIRTVSAPSGWGRTGEEGATNVHTPEILHYLYVFRRTGVAVA